MAYLCLILNLPESVIPGGIVLLETGNIFKEIRLQSVFPVFAFSYDPSGLLAPRTWIICHMNGSLSAFSQIEEGAE
jgi:hypothetical protein